MGPAIGAELIATYLLSKVGLKTRTDAQRVGFRCYAGRSIEELRAIMQALHDDHMARFISPAMQRRVEEHRRAGDALVILTASAFFFAEPIGRALGFDEVIGTSVALDRGVCTGAVDGPILDGASKLDAARAAAEARGASLERCAFYTDHIADLPLLEAVGRPVAVAPNRALARAARARGYPIVRHDDP